MKNIYLWNFARYLLLLSSVHKGMGQFPVPDPPVSCPGAVFLIAAEECTEGSTIYVDPFTTIPTAICWCLDKPYDTSRASRTWDNSLSQSVETMDDVFGVNQHSWMGDACTQYCVNSILVLEYLDEEDSFGHLFWNLTLLKSREVLYNVILGCHIEVSNRTIGEQRAGPTVSSSVFFGEGYTLKVASPPGTCGYSAAIPPIPSIICIVVFILAGFLHFK